MRSDRILLAHGSGGTMMRELIEDVFVTEFAEDALKRLDDAAALSFPGGRLAFSTDTYVVTPQFFPGGDIGRLAVCGTVNDVATSGATQTHSIGTTADVDWVSFTVDQSAPVVIETRGVAGGDTRMWLYGPDSSTTEFAYDDVFARWRVVRLNQRV